MIFRIFYAVIILMLTTGCSSKPEVAIQPAKPLPNWYMTPPENTNDWLVGVGSAETYDKAIQAALNDLVSRLGVSIESSIDYRTRSTNFGYTENTTQTIRSEVAKIRISNYEVAASEQIRFNQFVVMVKSNRLQFLSSLTKELDQKIAVVQDRVAARKTDHALMSYQASKLAAQEAYSLNPTLLIIGGLDEAFDPAPYLLAIRNLNDQSERARQLLLFQVQGDIGSRSMITPITNALTAEGYSIGNTPSRRGVFYINIYSSTQHSSSSGIQIANVLVKINVTDHQGNLVGSNSIALTGHATRGASLAEADAVNKMAKLIESQGIASILGIKL
ncbi:MAG: LPP20 family lipoprotein [Methyloprofundus sp.]|nr:LPP20 family lipoprotein [Methyloprofundus sp.]